MRIKYTLTAKNLTDGLIQYSKAAHPELNKKVTSITWGFFFFIAGVVIVLSQVLNLSAGVIRIVLIIAGLSVTAYLVILNKKHSKVTTMPQIRSGELQIRELNIGNTGLTEVIDGKQLFHPWDTVKEVHNTSESISITTSTGSLIVIPVNTIQGASSKSIVEELNKCRAK